MTSRIVLPRPLWAGATWVAPAILLGALVLLYPGTAPAQEQELRVLLERIERLERQLGTVQRRVDSAATRPTASAAPSGPLPPTAAARFELRVSQIEAEMRSLNGRVEEMGFAIDQIKSRLETMTSDLEYRLSTLEGGKPAKPGDRTARSAAPPTAPAQSSAPPTAPSPGAGTAPDGAPAQNAALTGGTVEEKYRHARAFLVQGEYGQAENALRAFIETHTDHALAGNAQYWLGETFYVRKQYEDAVVAYLEGYQTYPKSQKAPDNLLKLGMSLAHLGKKKEACTTFRQLRQKFPKARSTIRKTATSQRRKLGC